MNDAGEPDRQPGPWVALSPALGLIIGAAVALLLSILTGDEWRALTVAVGAGIGLVFGSLVTSLPRN